MARRNRRSKRLNFIAGTLALLFILFCVLRSLDDKLELGLGLNGPDAFSLDVPYEAIMTILDGGFGDGNTVETGQIDGLKVHFLDAGQAKSILIQSGSENVLIDAGESGGGDDVVSYLRLAGVKKLDILIGTHPHSDHIGGMDVVIDAFEIGMVILPDIPDEIVPTTKAYTDMLMAIAKKGLKITLAAPGEEYGLDGGAKLTILAPVKAYDDLNDISIVSRLDCGDISFIFTGDAEKDAELDILQSGAKLSADVLDVGHHGSETSSSHDFLAAVSPSIAVISCGIDNTYGHPARKAVERVEAAGAKIYRTDLDGAVIITTDGHELFVDVSK